MKKILLILLTCSKILAVGEAGAVFLLIAPGAGPVGTGEAQVAKADDVYASYYNPAGLAYLNGSEIAVMHVNWLPNLADDIYYDFLAYSRTIPGVGTFGTHLIYLNLGEQMRTDEEGTSHGTFNSNMWSLTGSFGSQITKSSSLGLGIKIIQQNLAPEGAGSEEGAGSSTNVLFDVGYLNKIIQSERLFLNELNFGLSISHIGPKIWFQDKAQADPPPTNMKFGIYSTLYNDDYNKLSILADANKLLVSRYPRMDWDGDGLIGDGIIDGSTINGDGQEEGAYSDAWYTAVFTSWLDDWYFGGDYDLNSDSIIGGWGCSGDGEITEEKDGSYDCSTAWEASDDGAYSEADDSDKVYLEEGSG